MQKGAMHNMFSAESIIALEMPEGLTSPLAFGTLAAACGYSLLHPRESVQPQVLRSRQAQRAIHLGFLTWPPHPS